jgi:hypothetical protein
MDLVRFTLVEPTLAHEALASLADDIDKAIQIQAVVTWHPSAQLALLDVMNVLACVGCPNLAGRDEMNALILQLPVATLPPLLQLRVGLAALAFGKPRVADEVVRAAGHSYPPFEPTARIRGDVWGLLNHLIGAHEANADRFAVLPAWRSVIELVTELRASGHLDEATLLWMARIIYHDRSRLPLDKVAEAAHEILWRVPDELENEAADQVRRQASIAHAAFPLNYTLSNGAFVVDTHLLGEGTQQMFLGHEVSSAVPVLLAYDIRGSRRSVDELRDAVSYRIPGVFELAFVGGFDARGGEEDHHCNSSWAVVERVPAGSWLPSLVSRDFDERRAPQMAIDLGLSAGRILDGAAMRGHLLVRIRPEYMWAEHLEDRWLVTGLSARGDDLFLRQSTELATVPLFDRYYYAPEWYRDPDERALVFSLAVMMAEWTMGQYPFPTLFYGKGLEQAEHLPIVAPPPLARLLEESLRFDPVDRPSLAELLAELALLESRNADHAR